MALDIPILNETIKAIDLLISKIDTLDKKMLDATQHFIDNGKKMAGAITPSSINEDAAAIDALTKKIKEQDATIQKLINDIDKLRISRKNNSQQSAEEAVNQGILNRQALEAARINSTLAGAYLKLNAQHQKAARLYQDLIVRGRQAGQSQREYNRELSNAKKEFEELNKRIIIADKAVGRFNRNVGNYPKQAFQGIKDLLGAFGIVGGVSAIAAITKDIYAQVKAQESLDLALKQVTGSQDEFARAQQFLTVLSEKYGVEINTLTGAYQKFYVSAIDKLKTKQIEDIFSSVTKAASSLGLTIENQDRVFTALNQMLSKGKVQAEELKGQLGDALPGAIGIMRRAYQALHPEQQITSAQFEKLMKDGKILAAEVLPEFSKELERTYNLQNVDRIDNLAAAQNRLTNAWKNFIRELNDGNGTLSKVFAQTTVGMGRIVDYFTEAIKDSNEAQAEKYAKLRTDAYKEEYDSLSDLGDKQKEVAAEREKELKPLFDAETKEKNELLAANKALKENNALRADGKIKNTEAREEYERNVKQIRFLNNDLYVLAGRLSAINKIRNEKPKATADPEEQSKADKKRIEDALKARAEALKKEIELQILKQEVILNGETNTYQEQYAALEKYTDLKLQLIEISYKEQIRLAKGNADKIKSAEYDREMAIIKQAQDGYSKLKTIRKKQNDEYIAEIKSIEEFLKQYYEDEQIRVEAKQELDEKVSKAKRDLIDKEIEKLKELKAATKEYTDSFIEEFAGNMGMSETFNTFIKQFDDGTGKMTTKFKQLLQGADSPLKKAQVYFTAIGEAAQEAFNYITEASQKNFDGEKKRLEEQYNLSVAFAGDNAEAKKKLDEDLEKRQKEIANREAKAKKKQALFNIAIDTAQAVVAALPNYVLAGIIAALGVAQAAVVSSQEIPQYWMGGTHDGGLMMVNDGKGSNYKETIITPDGKIIKPQGRNVIMDAPAGTEIYNHNQWNEKLAEMLQGKGIDMAPPSNSYSGISKNDMREAMLEAIGEQPQYHTSFDEDGITTRFIKKGNTTINLSKRGNSAKLRFK